MSEGATERIAVVGGTYYEKCLRPNWNEIYGSGGRAACALAQMGAQTTLHTYVTSRSGDQLQDLAELNGFQAASYLTPSVPSFDYTHGLDTPRIFGVPATQRPIVVNAELAVRFGMLEGDSVVQAKRVVYDPQNPHNPKCFHYNGSGADEVALIVNRSEAAILAGDFRGSVSEMAKHMHSQGVADVVVIKQGPNGLLVYDGSKIDEIPAYRTETVWKIGSGDNFTAHFAYNWLLHGRSAADSANLASKATAYYCATQGFASPETLPLLEATPVIPSRKFLAGAVPSVYLAGPFFTLADLWLVTEARKAMQDMGMNVFSPYHSVGLGSAADVVHKDLAAIDEAVAVFAICDGMDPGTVYEVGYARARGKTVVVYSENETPEARKMVEGSGCILREDFVSALYTVLWEAIQL